MSRRRLGAELRPPPSLALSRDWPRRRGGTAGCVLARAPPPWRTRSASGIPATLGSAARPPFSPAKPGEPLRRLQPRPPDARLLLGAPSFQAAFRERAGQVLRRDHTLGCAPGGYLGNWETARAHSTVTMGCRRLCTGSNRQGRWEEGAETRRREQGSGIQDRWGTKSCATPYRMVSGHLDKVDDIQFSGLHFLRFKLTSLSQVLMSLEL